MCASRRCTLFRRRRQKQRAGIAIVYFAILLVPITACMAFALDLGYLYLIRTELQRAADASALARASTLYPKPDAVELFAYHLPADDNMARLPHTESPGGAPRAGRPLTSRGCID